MNTQNEEKVLAQENIYGQPMIICEAGDFQNPVCETGTQCPKNKAICPLEACSSGCTGVCCCDIGINKLEIPIGRLTDKAEFLAEQIIKEMDALLQKADIASERGIKLAEKVKGLNNQHAEYAKQGKNKIVTAFIEKTATKTLLVDLEADPTSGEAPLNDVELTAVVSGTATGTIEYKFDCEGDDEWDYIFETSEESKTVTCNYPNKGSYKTKVQVTRESESSQATTVIRVLSFTDIVDVNIAKINKLLSNLIKTNRELSNSRFKLAECVNRAYELEHVFWGEETAVDIFSCEELSFLGITVHSVLDGELKEGCYGNTYCQAKEELGESIPFPPGPCAEDYFCCGMSGEDFPTSVITEYIEDIDYIGNGYNGDDDDVPLPKDFKDSTIAAVYGRPNGWGTLSAAGSNPDKAIQLTENFANQVDGWNGLDSVITVVNPVLLSGSTGCGSLNPLSQSFVQNLVQKAKNKGYYVMFDVQTAGCDPVAKMKEVIDNYLLAENVFFDLDIEWINYGNGTISSYAINEIAEYYFQKREEKGYTSPGVFGFYIFQLYRVTNPNGLKNTYDNGIVVPIFDGYGDCSAKQSKTNAMINLFGKPYGGMEFETKWGSKYDKCSAFEYFNLFPDIQIYSSQ